MQHLSDLTQQLRLAQEAQARAGEEAAAAKRRADELADKGAILDEARRPPPPALVPSSCAALSLGPLFHRFRDLLRVFPARPTVYPFPHGRGQTRARMERAEGQARDALARASAAEAKLNATIAERDSLQRRCTEASQALEVLKMDKVSCAAGHVVEECVAGSPEVFEFARLAVLGQALHSPNVLSGSPPLRTRVAQAYLQKELDAAAGRLHASEDTRQRSARPSRGAS